MNMIDNESEDIQKRDRKEGGRLFVVSTPIGNRLDITYRAVEAIRDCDLVICEEFKVGAKTMKDLNLTKDLDTLNENNEQEKVYEFLGKLKSGMHIALISDCGTPLFADPGYELVRAAVRSGLAVEVVPGVTSIMTALVRSTFNIDGFVFAGFLSRKPEDRFKELKEIARETRTVALLETPYRFSAFMDAAAKVMPDRQVYIGMNLTMPFESHHYGTFSELRDKFDGQKVRAEFVVCIEGNSRPDSVKKAIEILDADEYSDEIIASRSSERREYSDRKPRESNYGGERRSYNPHDRSEDRPRRSGGFERRSDRDEHSDRSDRGERRYDNRDSDRRSGGYGGGDRKFGDRKPGFSGDRKFGDRKPGFSGDRKFDDRRSDDRRPERHNDGDEHRSGGYGEKKFGDRKPGFGGDRKFGDRKPGFGGDRKFGDRKPGFGGDRKFGDRDKSYGSREGGERKFDDRGDRGDFKEKRSFGGGDKKFGGKKPFGGGGKKFGKR